jgi:hypothetical protein
MKKTNITLSIALAAVFSSAVSFAETEVTGKFTYERAQYSESGSTIGDFGKSTYNGDPASVFPATAPYKGVTNAATPSHGSDEFKSEVKAQIFIDGDVNDDATFHVELQGVTNAKATTNYDSNESYTQRDMLREAYVDTEMDGWSIRAGKQQVVWGTADGMKLLDAINPTDYGEMAQNQMEDSRIPVWMLNAEITLEDGSEFQVVASQPRENVFAGLNRNVSTHVRKNNTQTLVDESLNEGTDTGHAFMMMGPDTITGARNGFLNITPDLGSVAGQFGSAFSAIHADDEDNLILDLASGGYYVDGVPGNDANVNLFKQKVGAGGFGNLYAVPMEGFTVGGFSAMTMDAMNTALSNNGYAADTDAGGVLANITPGFRKAIGDTFMGLVGNFGGDVTKLASDDLNKAARTLMIGYYGMTLDNLGVTALTEATLTADQLTGAIMLDAGFAPLYSSNLSSFQDKKDNSAFDYMTKTTFRTFDAFVNANSQYVYNMPSDGEVDLALRFKNTTKNGVNYSLNTTYNYDKNPIIDLSWRGDAGQKLTTHEYDTYYTAVGLGTLANHVAKNTTLQIVDTAKAVLPSATTWNSAGVYTDGTGGLYGGAGQKAATLQFSQEVKRVVNIGGSFDTAIETAELGPVVIRGEALYTKGGYSPVMNKDRLAIGDLVGALQMVKGDRVKFVLGADITALTNMMISAQFIQDSNLDFVDNGNNYTTDYATMHLSNGFNKGIKDKNYYSLFFSKPFGASGEHRWNNITMLEEGVSGNGKWNRLDAEFSIDDDTQATIEYNKYWGNANTQFGQLANSSNIQLGVKYSF